MLTNDNSNALKVILDSLKKYLKSVNFALDAPFSRLGITSLDAAQFVMDINSALNVTLKAHDLFLYSTPHALARYLTDRKSSVSAAASRHFFDEQKNTFHHEPIAIIAMDCKYPRADNYETFWRNCLSNKDCITFFDAQKSQSADSHSSYNVYARGVLSGIDQFDAQFFNYSPREAHLSDPQHRLFLESSWKALEKAGYASQGKACGSVGVYASMNDSTYLLDQYALQGTQDNLTDRFALQRLMSSQFLATRIAYFLNASGPAMTVQTACSSSLVAVALACQQLSSGECDMAIAGGVSIVTPQDRPYVYQQGNIYSPDGHCRPFDANAQGTVFSNGLGVVVLKRLSDALRDRDFIVSVIKGYGLNNDGNDKMSYAAPSMQGQLDCILLAQARARVAADTIQYVETHGTGTLIGDPIEIEALTKAFRQSTTKEQFCAIGSVKANIGHTHVAAGVAGLIKTSLALQHQKIPSLLHFNSPNPAINFERSPFYVNTRVLHWRRKSSPRRAAVSAFGVGGTNAHVILEEAPERENYPSQRRFHSVLLSAKSKEALNDYRDEFVRWIENTPNGLATPADLANLAYTLQVGRNTYPHRLGLVCENFEDALTQLKKQKGSVEVKSSGSFSPQKKIVFLFSGQGTQYVNMSRALYESEPIYRKELDGCLAIAAQYTDVDLHTVLFPIKNDATNAPSKIFQTQYAHPLLFSIAYALAKLLQVWGIFPDALLGHSLGEYVAASLAGVFSLEDAIRLVCARGKAIALCEEGVMLSVPLSPSELEPFCNERVSIAVQTAPHSCVLSGSTAGVEEVKSRIEATYPEKYLPIKKLVNSHPFHTRLLEKAVAPFSEALQSIEKNTPKIPYLSNLTGDWINSADSLSDQYWIDHLLKTVQLSRCMKKLLNEGEDTIFIEIGAGRTLLSALQMHATSLINSVAILPSAEKSKKVDADQSFALALKALWTYGCAINWEAFYADEKRNRLPLPTYPFQRQRFWIDEIYAFQKPAEDAARVNLDLGFYASTWVCAPTVDSFRLELRESPLKPQWIIFANGSRLSQKTCEQLVKRGETVIKVFCEKDKAFSDTVDYVIDPKDRSQYLAIFEKFLCDKRSHYAVIHFWCSEERDNLVDASDLLDDDVLHQGLYSGIFIHQAFSQFVPKANVSWVMLTSQAYSVLGNELINPLKSIVLGLCRVLPLENPNSYLAHVDVGITQDESTLNHFSEQLIDTVIKGFEVDSQKDQPTVIALRYKKRWIPAYTPITLESSDNFQAASFVDSGVYLITGGLGGMGLSVADWISSKGISVSLVLLSRRAFPKREEWSDWLTNHSADDETSKKIQMLNEIISKGASVEIIKADIADANQMQAVVGRIERSFGRVNGIFHLAGIPGKGLATLKEIDDVKKVLSPKIQGTQVLIEVFRKKELDFFVAASSLTAIAGGVGQIDYCAANIFLDHYIAQKPLERCKRFLTINWNAWRSVGMAVDAGQLHCRLYSGNSVTPEKGVFILEKLLNVPHNQVIVSRYSPEDEVSRIKAAFQRPQEKSAEKIESTQVNLEELLVQAWEKVLGVSDIDQEASFYDYGGDSLTLVQLIAMLENRSMKLTLQDLVQHPTFKGMLAFLESRKKLINLAQCA